MLDMTAYRPPKAPFVWGVSERGGGLSHKGPLPALDPWSPGSLSDGLDILDFYRDRATRDLYKSHMTHMVNRVNVFTGVKYKGGYVAGCAGGGEPGDKWMGSDTNAIYSAQGHVHSVLACRGESGTASSEDGRQWVHMSQAIEPEGTLWLN